MSIDFKADFFANNRQALQRSVGSGALIVLAAHTLMQRGVDSAYAFEQESNFWYLTGLDYPDWQVIMDGAGGKTYLVEPDIDPLRAVFDGRLGREEAAEVSGITTILDPIEAKRLLLRLRSQHPLVYTLTPQALHLQYGFAPNPAQKQLVDQLATSFQVRDCRAQLQSLRAIKQPLEIAAIQQAIDITIDGIEKLLVKLPTLTHEYQAEAELSYWFRSLGADGHAYDPLIAGGRNACTLHYQQNSAPLHKKDWLLLDVGAKYHHYCADLTRTVPLGKPTKRQIAVYEAVRRVHDAAIALCTPGQSVKEYQTAVDAAMRTELANLGLDHDDTGLAKYFPHAISHGLGVDVHDSLGKPLRFAENMVLTVEPGIYIPEEGLGIRIENDILITASGPQNLSARLPVDLAEIQNWIGR